MSLLSAHQVTKTYRAGNIDIQGIDFAIEPASFVAFVAFVGPSGSGKSTLLNMVGHRADRQP